MTSIVLELQKEAMDKNIEISDLLRKALAVAIKLNITDFIIWVNQELYGYKEGDDIPEYRIVEGIIKEYTPNHRIEALHINKQSTREIHYPVSEIIACLKDKKEGCLIITYPENEYKLIEKMKHTLGIKNVNMELVLQVEDATFTRILDTVRTKVLEYALKLEQEGIIGTGISFSTEEKQKASSITYNITNNIGSMNNSQLQQSSATANQTYNGNLNIDNIKSLIKEIKAKTPDLNLSDQDLTKLNSKIEELEKQINLNTPQDNIIKQCLTSIRTICEGVASNAIAVSFINWIATIQ
jgi:hypothetical protein